MSKPGTTQTYRSPKVAGTIRLEIRWGNRKFENWYWKLQVILIFWILWLFLRGRFLNENEQVVGCLVVLNHQYGLLAFLYTYFVFCFLLLDDGCGPRVCVMPHPSRPSMRAGRSKQLSVEYCTVTRYHITCCCWLFAVRCVWYDSNDKQQTGSYPLTEARSIWWHDCMTWFDDVINVFIFVIFGFDGFCCWWYSQYPIIR